MNTEQWHNTGEGLQEELEIYNWEYRFKICSKCPIKIQHERGCIKGVKHRTIRGKTLRDTYCNWLVKARTKKFKDKINSFINLGLRSKYGSI